MKKTILIAAVMFLAFTVAASAQALFQVGSTPVTTVASCGTTELTGDVQFSTATSSLGVTTGTITISYGVPITSIANLQIFVNGAAEADPSAATSPVQNISSGGPTGDLAGGRLVLAINPALSVDPITSIIVRGVRVNIAGNPGLTNLTAQVTATGNSFVGGQTSVVVISSIASAISNVTVGGALNNISAVSPAGGTATVRVTEGFLNAWNVTPAGTGPAIALTFSAIPAGVSLSFPAAVSTQTGSVFQFATATGTPAAPTALDSTSTNLTVYYVETTPAGTFATTTEVLYVPVTVSINTLQPLPLAQGSVTVTANMAPVAGTTGLGNYIPQYTGTTCQKGPATVLTIVTASTNLLIPYAVVTSTYDTGIAIANTTTDPWNDLVKQSGTIKFYFFPSTGSSFTYTTAAVPSGGLYTILLSQLLSAAQAPSTFSGYIFAVCNFTNAHGQYFISDFAFFTNGALMLVVTPTSPGALPNGTPRPSPESLGN